MSIGWGRRISRRRGRRRSTPGRTGSRRIIRPSWSVICAVKGTSLIDGGEEDFFHRQARAAAGEGHLVPAAIGPERIRGSAERGEPGIVAVLISGVDGGTGRHAVAVVLIRAFGADAHVG